MGTITHVAASNDTLYARTEDGSVWFWWKGGARWDRDHGSGPPHIEWVAVR